MFDLSKQAAMIAHLNIRNQKHGDDEVLAMDIKFEFDSHNSFLNKLHDDLQDIFYAAPKDADPEHKTLLKLLQLASFSWNDEIEKAEVIIHGEKKADDIKLQGKLNKVKIECLEGGTIKTAFRLQVLPDTNQVGLVSGLLHQDVKISVGNMQASLI